MSHEYYTDYFGEGERFMKIIFTKHAEKKFGVLREHKCVFAREQVIEVLHKPDSTDVFSRAPLYVAQKGLDKRRVLRVVYRKEENHIIVITFYPGRRKQYEKNK